MYEIVVTGADRTVETLSTIPPRVMQRLAVVVPEQTKILFGGVQAKIGAIFKPGTGRLFGSLRNESRTMAAQVVGRVFTQGVPYAAAQEYGVTFTHPGSSKPQSFMGRDGKRVFTNFTKPHKITIPERSYARSTLTDQRLAIVSSIRAAITEEFAK